MTDESRAATASRPSAWLDKNGRVVVREDLCGGGFVRADGAIPENWTPLFAASETATPNDWHEAQAEIHNLQRDREALRNENARRAAMFDAAIGQLVKIKGFVHPDGFIVNGKGYSFNPPIELVREAWEALSKAIREIEPPQPEARCVVGQKDK